MIGSEWTSIRSGMGPEGEIELKVATDPGSLAERWALWTLNRTRRTWMPWWLLPAVLLANLAVQGGFFWVVSRGTLFGGHYTYFAATLTVNLGVLAIATLMLLERRGYAELLDRYAIELRRLQRQKAAGGDL
jgi:hypothetical protein